jgi:putative transposase
MQEHGVFVDHVTVHRWVLKYSPQLEEAFHRPKRPVWLSWRMDETGQTTDFLLTEQRDERAAERFLTKAIRRYGVPAKVTIDGSEANAATIRSYIEEHGTAIAFR